MSMNYLSKFDTIRNFFQIILALYVIRKETTILNNILSTVKPVANFPTINFVFIEVIYFLRFYGVIRGRLISGILIICPSYLRFRLLRLFNKISSCSSLRRIFSFLILLDYDIFLILWYNHISNALTLFEILMFSVHDSHPYTSTDHM